MRRSLLRDHKDGHAEVTALELFFDLVYVFAVTQLSHFLHDHFSWLGVIEGLVLFGAVWWAWMYTTWATNWAEPARVPVRVMLVLVMLAGLVMSAAIPDAFNGFGLLFAVPLVLVQVGRSLFIAYAMHRSPDAHTAANMLRIACWFTISGVFWITGALSDPHARLYWWAGAVAVEYFAPAISFRLPFFGRSRAEEWDIAGDHMAERCGLFIIIALGEGIIVTGATYASEPVTVASFLALFVALMGSVLLWWLYFDVGAERGAEHIAHHRSPGRVARFAYTYLHMPIVGGIVCTAVADAVLLEAPFAPASPKLIVMGCGGTFAYLVGVGIFKRGTARFGNFPLSHWAGIFSLPLLALWSHWSSPTALEAATILTAILAIVAVWEWRSYNGGWATLFGTPEIPAGFTETPSPQPTPRGDGR